eukprot:5246363-Pleurochrysis_carterae.AAC.1
MPHFLGIAICHDDDDDGGPFLESNVAVASPAKIFLPHQVARAAPTLHSSEGAVHRLQMKAQ